MKNAQNYVVIIGAGPAGLTAAYELQKNSNHRVIIIETDKQVGGISRTVNYQGNRIDIGGHRFFSKSDWVMNWWLEILPILPTDNMKDISLQYQGNSRATPNNPTSPSIENNDNIMLIRNRLSRIYYNRQFFDYPLKLNFDSIKKLGLYKTIVFGFSYVYSHFFPIKHEQSLEDFFINRFGNKLYHQFFKEYTEKVWGVACCEISADWGAQRIKSLSVAKALWHALKSALGIKEKKTQTSLIESFLYPKYGPGQMWEVVSKKIIDKGGILKLNTKVINIDISDNKVHRVEIEDIVTKSREWIECSYAISTMPIKDLVNASLSAWTDDAVKIAKHLEYRDFITVGLLYEKASLREDLKDNWIYIQEPGVQVGRVQIFNNWSPYMIASENFIWLGLEFFCKETDALWNMQEKDLKKLAQKEMIDIGLIKNGMALDSVVIKVPKAYPGYFGDAYKNFSKLQTELDSVNNLFLVGRNGMHRYNNQDHSMLTAKEATDQIIKNKIDKSKLWAINIDDEYHEEQK
jgi:protoporphyrinogen oxidase